MAFMFWYVCHGLASNFTHRSYHRAYSQVLLKDDFNTELPSLDAL